MDMKGMVLAGGSSITMTRMSRVMLCHDWPKVALYLNVFNNIIM